MIYGAILDGRIAWREAQRQHAVWCGSAEGPCGGRWLVAVVATSHEDASELPATRDFIVVARSQTIVGRPIREEHAPEERAGAYYLEKDRNL